jgi:triacylglycerol lipase
VNFSKSLALDLCALNEQAYVLANTGHCKLPDGFTAPVAIRMPKVGRPLFLDGDPLDIWGFITTRSGEPHIVFRGTQFTSGIQFAQEWAEDALSLPLEPFPKGHVHLGFFGAWRCLRQPLIDTVTAAGLKIDGPKVITGHSLGAAIATLCWADLEGDLMTFAGPRVGDPDFGTAMWEGGVVRIVNAPDIVPEVPSDPPFRHGGQEIVVHGPGGLLDRVKAHDLSSYGAGLRALPDA